MRTLLALSLVVAFFVACEPAASRPPVAKAASTPPPKRHGAGEMVPVFQRQAKAARGLVKTPLANRFLDATAALPSIQTRTIQHDGRTIEVDEERYYDADVNDLLAYARPLEVAASLGIDLPPGSRMLDFGYGSIGHLRMLASLGIDARGIEVQPQLLLYYAQPGDTGAIPGLAGGPSGNVRLYDGYYPKDPKLVADVGSGYDFVIAKNVLKKGYIHPDRPTQDKWLIKLGVDDATFLRTFHDALKSKGSMLVYNIFVPIPLDQEFKPMSDGRSPFSKEQWEAGGFVVRAFDRDDSEGMRQLFAAIATDDAERAETKEYQALYTLVQRKD